MAQRLKIPGFLQTRAAFEPGTFDEKAGTVEVVFSTGARGIRYSWDGPFYEELEVSERAVDLSRLNNGAPYLDDHPYKRGEGGTKVVLGVVERAWLAGPAGKKEGRALIRFSDRDEVKPIKRDVQTGILRHVSIGYSIQKMEKVEEVEKVPVYRATRWTPFEISQTPIGFDDRATVRGKEAQEFHHEVEVFSTAEETRAMANETTPATPAPAAAAAIPQPASASPAAPATIAADGARAIEQAVAQAAAARIRETREQAEASARAAAEAQERERLRIAEIQSLVRRHELGDELEQTLIRSGAPIDQVNAAVLRHLAARTEGSPMHGHLGIQAGDDKRDKFIRGACASIFHRAGTAEAIEAAKKEPRFAAHMRDVSTDPGEFRGMRLIDLARAALELRGVSTRGLYGEALVKRALEYRDAGMNTTSDLGILLETAVGKTFLGQYAITPVTWPRWCGRKSTQDFRTATFYRPGSFGTLDAVSESGEIKHKNIPDGEKASLTPSTKGNIVGITRKALVNDDLGAFQNLAAGLGQAAAFTVESDAFGLITANAGLGPTQADGQPLFHSNRANIGGAGAMSVDTWDSAASVMAAQKDVSKNLVLDLSPAVWVGPRSLLLKAKTLNANATDPTSNKVGVSNPVQNMVRDLVGTARLPGAGGTATRHYFLADPAIYPVFAVGFIDGQEAPKIDSQQVFGFDGLQIQIVFDYGVGVLDFRGAIASPGV